MKHKHNWSYEHTIWQGDKSPNEVGVHRYCSCGKHQMAFTSSWRKPRKGYKLTK